MHARIYVYLFSTREKQENQLWRNKFMDADLPYQHHYSEPDRVDHMDAIYSADGQIGHMWNS